MRSYTAAAFSIAMIVPTMLLARSDESPTLDVQPVCRGIASQSGDTLASGLMKDTLEECLKSEQEVRHQLNEKWSTFSAADKQHCVSLAKTGGEASYTELLTCLEMSRDVRALRVAANAPAETKTSKRAASPASTPAASSALTPKEQPALTEKAMPSTPVPAPPDKTAPSPTGKESQASPAKEALATDQTKKEVDQARSEAQAAKASEAAVKLKLADAEAALQRAKEEARRASADAASSKADAKSARDTEDTLKRKLADTEAARVAAEGREQACTSAAKAQSGFGGRLRSWFGPKEPDAKNP